MVPKRLARLELRPLPGGGGAHVALSLRARLLGLAWLSGLPADTALLIPRCSCVHTFGMRFPIDVTFLSADDRTLEVRRAVPCRRIVRHGDAAAVLERPAYAAPTRPPSR